MLVVGATTGYRRFTGTTMTTRATSTSFRAMSIGTTTADSSGSPCAQFAHSQLLNKKQNTDDKEIIIAILRNYALHISRSAK